ncbi:hypothetical protein DLM78_21675 [Leptospira stimsonii]|uniref:Uncharacterized protein n=1 Tax=Leptospira stimsonii TaxID=2202203 RepID=A0A8B3CL71_9LEPT|nr:hypothetical protein DLM78_21675 [Leptospira stimsonii]
MAENSGDFPLSQDHDFASKKFFVGTTTKFFPARRFHRSFSQLLAITVLIAWFHSAESDSP